MFVLQNITLTQGTSESDVKAFESPCSRTPNQPVFQQLTAAATSVPYLDLSLCHLSAGKKGLHRAEREHRMKEGMSNNSTTSISQARKAVEQLKMEAGMDRVKVSQAASDLLAYCEAHVREDPLIIPVPASENPFREKKFFCTIL
ncbi:guanine nucleotide binding protein (G protein) gamma 4 [Cricetulus griseus]